MAYIGNQGFKIIEAHIGTVAGADTSAAILAKPKVNGQLWIASDTGHLYLSDGVQWQDVGQLEGDQGEVGPRGVSITSVTKTGTAGAVDLYTVTYSDATTSTFTVTNANTWLTGAVAPTTQGNNGDLYLDTNTNYYYKKSTGTWTLQGTLRGASFSYDGVGTLAGRAAHNDETTGYGYLALDEAVPTVYYKMSAASGDWDSGTTVGKGEQGNGIVSTTFTSTTDVSGLAGKPGAVDTYTITYDNADTDTFVVYNGKDMTNAAVIDDTIVVTNATWSSDKISSLIIEKPTITSPTNGTVNYIGAVTATYTNTTSYIGAQDYVKWECATDASFNTIIDSYEGNANLLSWTPSIGLALTTVYVRVKQGSDGHLSTWSDTLSFTTPNIFVQNPTLAVTGTPSDVTETPTLTTSAFSVYNGSDTHVSTDWVVTQGGTEVWSSMADTSNKTSIVVPAGELVVNTAYVFKARHNGSTYGASGWVEVSGTTKTSFSIQYGLQWNNTADTYTRLGAAVGWTTGASFTNNNTTQALMRRCVLNANGTVNYYLSATDSTKKEDGVTAADLTGASGNVMVEIPKFWVKYDNTTSAKQMWISTAPAIGYVVHPAFVKNGVEVDYRYYRAYKGSVSGTKLISKSGVAAAGNETIIAFRAKAQSNGTGWGLVDWNLLFAVQTLLFIEIGTFNSQAVLGNGNDTGSDYGMTTGGSNSIGNASSPSTNDDTWMSYRGIENFYADIFEWIDGINISERLVYTSNMQSTFASDVFSGAYTSTGITLPSSGYVSDMNFSTKGFIPTVSAGSDSTYVTDYVYSNTGSRVAAFGGSASNGLACGAACLYANYASSSASANIGAGLSF